MQNSWIDRFCEAHSHLTSPHIFIKWGAINAVSGALERKVWVRTKGSNLYPNMYCVLVAPAGVGKSEVTNRVRDMWLALEDVHVADSSVTRASLIDDLNAATRKFVSFTSTPPVMNFNTLLAAVNELGVLIPSYESDFMHTLTDIYDCKSYSESRRTRNVKIKIEMPSISLFAACTPAYLKSTLPPGAWDQGFLSRVVLIYSGEQQLSSVFVETEVEENCTGLIKELKEINNLYGQFNFTSEAKDLIDRWYLGGQAPVPDHPRLVNYLTRRITHLLKLCMVSSAARGSNLLIDGNNVQEALNWLIEAEFYMPEIFKAMASGGDSQIITETFHYLYTTYMKDQKKPVNENRLILFLQERTPAHNILRIVETMIRAGMIEVQYVSGQGNCYVPKKSLE